MNKRGGITIPPEIQSKLNGVKCFQLKTTDKGIVLAPIRIQNVEIRKKQKSSALKSIAQ